ncbi:hypothetical protein IWQ62_005352, partial [Dispira parvispora]
AVVSFTDAEHCSVKEIRILKDITKNSYQAYDEERKYVNKIYSDEIFNEVKEYSNNRIPYMQKLCAAIKKKSNACSNWEKPGAWGSDNCDEIKRLQYIQPSQVSNNQISTTTY